MPARAPTAGDAVLAQLPGGADLLVELDLARLRGNPTVGALAEQLLADPAAGLVLSTDAPLARADSVVIAGYDLGTSGAHTQMIFSPTAR